MSIIRTGNGEVVDNNNPLPARITTDDILPTSIQDRYATTIQTHNAVSIALSGNSASSYIDCNGFDKLAITLKNDASTNSSVDVQWSHDGTNQHSYETAITNSTVIEKVGLTDIKARYVRLRVYNNDGAAAHVMSAWAYLKA